MSWAGFLGIFALFFATHSIPVRPAIKSRLTTHLGVRGFFVGYSVLSLAMLALLIWAAGQAPYVELWPQLGWQRHVVHVGMLLVCLILASSIGRPNPFSFGGARNETFDPARPGIVRLTRHPVLAALALWAFLHLLPNGNLAHVLLFVVLGCFAIGGRHVVNRRKQQEMGQQKWDHLNAAVAQASFFGHPPQARPTARRIIAGVAVFAILLVLHQPLIGVSAM